jgi:hypothetical protein
LADAAAIRAVFEQEGELSAAIELRRRFLGITDKQRQGARARPDDRWVEAAAAYAGEGGPAAVWQDGPTVRVVTKRAAFFYLSGISLQRPISIDGTSSLSSRPWM